MQNQITKKNNNGKTDADKKEKYKVNDKKDIKKLPMKYNNEKNSIKYKDNSKKEKEIKEVVKK